MKDSEIVLESLSSQIDGNPSILEVGKRLFVLGYLDSAKFRSFFPNDLLSEELEWLKLEHKTGSLKESWLCCLHSEKEGEKATSWLKQKLKMATHFFSTNNSEKQKIINLKTEQNEESNKALEQDSGFLPVSVSEKGEIIFHSVQDQDDEAFQKWFLLHDVMKNLGFQRKIEERNGGRLEGTGGRLQVTGGRLEGTEARLGNRKVWYFAPFSTAFDFLSKYFHHCYQIMETFEKEKLQEEEQKVLQRKKAVEEILNKPKTGNLQGNAITHRNLKKIISPSLKSPEPSTPLPSVKSTQDKKKDKSNENTNANLKPKVLSKDSSTTSYSSKKKRSRIDSPQNSPILKMVKFSSFKTGNFDFSKDFVFFFLKTAFEKNKTLCF